MAGFASFMCFMIFGSIPFLSAIFIPNRYGLIATVCAVSLITLFVSGALGSFFGGASLWKGALRNTIGGALAIGITAAVGVATDYSGADSLNF